MTRQTIAVVVVFAILPCHWVRSAEPIKVQSAFVRVLEEAEIPAREAGILAEINVRDGDAVKATQEVGSLDDDDAKLMLARAQLELSIAEKQAKNSIPVRTAQATLREAEQDRHQAVLSQKIAEMKASNDVSVRHATKSRDLSKAELERALRARKTFEKSISKTEIDRLTLALERSDLEIEKAKFENELAALQQQIEEASLLEQDQAIDRLKLSVEQATFQKAVDELTRDLKLKTVEQAQVQVSRRQLRSPFDGVVVETFRHRGEWVEPGQRVLRIVRLDRLKVEGFVDSRQATSQLRGAPVRVRVDVSGDDATTVKGRVVFVSPEIDPVNNQVRIWAEVENPDLSLRPGLSAEMLIEPAAKTK